MSSLRNTTVRAAAFLPPLALVLAGAASAQQVTAAPPDPVDERIDEYGISVPISANHPGRRFPAEEDFPSGPAIGERLPDFRLLDQWGESIDFHASRGDRKAALVFYRSAVW